MDSSAGCNRRSGMKVKVGLIEQVCVARAHDESLGFADR